jgi:cytidylate kinase
MRQVNIMRSRAAERVQRSDDENAWFYRHSFGLDWTDHAVYDLILDTTTGTVGEPRRSPAPSRFTRLPRPEEPVPASV